MATRNVMTATFGQSRRRHDNLSATIDFSISLLIYQFPNSALKLRRSLCAFCIIPPSLFSSSSSSAAQLGLALRPVDSFATPRCVGDRFSLCLRLPPAPTLIASVKRVAGRVDKQIVLLTDWLSVCLSFFAICMIYQGAPHCALLWIAECVKIAFHIAHQQNLHAAAQFSQFPNWVFRFLGSIDWAAGQRFCTKIKTNNSINWQAGDFLLLFFYSLALFFSHCWKFLKFIVDKLLDKRLKQHRLRGEIYGRRLWSDATQTPI